MLPGPGKGNQHPQGQGLYVRTDKVKQTAPVIVVAEVDATPAMPEHARLTADEVMMVEMEMEDTSDAGIYQASLVVVSRGQELQPAMYLDECFFYNWKCVGSLTPLKRCKSMPKLERMGIPIMMLVKLTSNSLT